MKYPFQLDKDFVSTYQDVTPPFGFGALGEFTFYRTYSRTTPNGENEQWHETVERVVNGTYSMQKEHCANHSLSWSESKAQRSAQEMYDRIFNMKFLPPGRGLWAMGAEPTMERKLYASLNNCAFVSTENIATDLGKSFAFLMDMSMLGVGVGFDTLGKEGVVVKGFDNRKTTQFYEIPDSREGWVQSITYLIDSGLTDGSPWKFDYSKIRPKGELIRGFGGKASGPEPLVELHEEIRQVLNSNKGEPLTERSIVDIMNMIGKCVIAGNVRRTAELALGSGSEEFLDLKNYEQNPERVDYGWTSNNSIVATVGMDYAEAAERTRINGEPGYIWLDNARKFGRMGDEPNGKDYRVAGFNPCVEQPLESYEMCNLVELFPSRHDTIQDLLRTAKFAYLYAKTVTLGLSHWSETNRVLTRNRRIGASMTGVVQTIAKHGIEQFREWCDTTYQYIQTLDASYSDWLSVPRSIKTTTVKPSGTVSLLAGATPGVHYPDSRYYIRRVRVAKDSVLVNPLLDAGYTVTPDAYDKSSYVIDFPVSLGEGVKTLDEVSIWQQFSLAAFMQRYWSDNGVSCTVSFTPEEGHMIEDCLNFFQYSLKAVSLLPRTEEGAYEQMPYESITKEKYEELTKDLKPLEFNAVSGEKGGGDKFCDADYCEI